jgi:uncharacterized protein YfaT (DUF1175 family)
MLTRRSAFAFLLPLPFAALADSPLPVLRDAGDQHAFCAWFTWLAEAVFFIPAADLPVEIRDCSSLVRFAYRNALIPHTAAWARSFGLTFPMPPLPEISRRGFEPLLRTGRDEAAHFADAAHLMRYNFRRIAGEWRAAQPGDTLFWNQKPGQGADHCMVWLGPSSFEDTPGPYVVYHTGPEGKWAGEVRRPSIRELLNHPEPRWHPVRGNPHFLGVFRWNLLLGGD